MRIERRSLVGQRGCCGGILHSFSWIACMSISSSISICWSRGSLRCAQGRIVLLRCVGLEIVVKGRGRCIRAHHTEICVVKDRCGNWIFVLIIRPWAGCWPSDVGHGNSAMIDQLRWILPVISASEVYFMTTYRRLTGLIPVELLLQS